MLRTQLHIESKNWASNPFGDCLISGAFFVDK